MRLERVLPGILALLAPPGLTAADGRPAWATEGPRTDEDAIALEVPMRVFANQLHVEVEVNGTPRRFLFDTGSPSMMTSTLAAELGLEAIDRRQGRDSNGAVVDTDIVQADLTVGGTTFRKVPVFVADFPKVPQCLFDGVLGSELLPLCAWQIDVPGAALRCNTDASALAHVANAQRLQLHDFGYPHAPFLDVRLADDATSKVLFDTGSPEYMAISPPDLEGAKRNNGVGATRAGAGSIGGSIGGRAPEKDQLLVRLNALKIGNVSLGRVAAVRRESPPSLIGASILEHFVVTLDARNSTAWFDQYRDGPFEKPSFGFGLGFEDSVFVSMVWEDSPADMAGLRVGQVVTSLGGRRVDSSCEGIRGAMQAMSADDRIDVEWEGGATTLVRQAMAVD